MQHLHKPRMIGAIEVTPLWDGPLASGLGKIPDPAHRREAEELIAKAPADAMTMPIYGYLLKQDNRYALIDTGAGTLVNQDLGKLPGAMQALGVNPDRVERIFLTHVHRDHYGGLLTPEGKAAFPNSELILHETEAAFWIDSKYEDVPPRAQRYFHSTQEGLALYAKNTRRVKEGEEIFGITARLAPGHTPGHTCWLMRSQGQSLLAWGDLVHIAWIHLSAPHIAMEYDIDPQLAMQSRLRVLDWVARENIPVAGAHLPIPGVCRIVHKAGAYALAPFE